MPRTFLGRCQRLGHCGFAPNCFCEVDPTDPRDIAAWIREEAIETSKRSAKAGVIIQDDVKLSNGERG